MLKQPQITGCEVYLDDVVMCSSTWVRQLAVVFDRLADASLTLNLVKCEFGQATVTYLGKVVGHGKVFLFFMHSSFF